MMNVEYSHSTLIVFLADLLFPVRSPTGEVFKISKDAKFQGGRINSLNKV